MDLPGRRTLAAAAAGIGVLALVGAGSALLADDAAEADPLSPEAPSLADFSFRAAGPCRFDAGRGGLVGHFVVSTHDVGRFTMDLEAVPHEGVGDLDVTTEHAVRVSVPFFAGQTRKDFDVVVPLSGADHARGYDECRYTLNPTGPD